MHQVATGPSAAEIETEWERLVRRAFEPRTGFISFQNVSGRTRDRVLVAIHPTAIVDGIRVNQICPHWLRDEIALAEYLKPLPMKFCLIVSTVHLFGVVDQLKRVSASKQWEGMEP